MKKTQSKKLRSGHLEFTFFGAPEIRVGARVVHFQSRKTTALLAYLMLEPGQHARDTLASLLWADSDRSAGRSSLRTALAEINTEFGTGNPLIQATRDALAWNETTVVLDVQELELAFRAARQGVGVEGESQLETAAALFKGDLLEGIDFSDAPVFDDWLIAEREIVRGWLDVVLENLCNLQAETGKFSAALETAQHRVRLEPLSEIAHQSVIALHVQNGNRAAALEAYRACETMLETELGLEPTAQTKALLEHPDLSPKTRAADFRNARVGASLEVGTRLVGREREWAQIEAAWRLGRNVYISGEAGTGKTRLMLEFADQ